MIRIASPGPLFRLLPPECFRPGCRFPAVALVTLLVCVLVSCASPCGKEGEQTRETLSKAQSARADIYARAAYTKAAGLAGEAEEECRAQERRFLPVRSYSRALTLHSEARAAAEKAAMEGSANEGLVRQEALNSRLFATESVETARASVVRARKGRGDAAGGNLMERWSLLPESLAEMQARIDRGDYLSARDLGDWIVRESVRIQGAANRGDMDLPPPPPPPAGLY